MSKPQTRFTFVGVHAQDLEGGRVVAPGERVDLDKKGQEDNARLIDEGLLLKYETTKIGEGNNNKPLHGTTSEEGDPK